MILHPRPQFPRKLQFLFLPKRYKVAYGGRGAAKTWSFSRALIIKGIDTPLRIGCFREIQNSIKDSVHKTLSDQIKLLGQEEFYEVQQNRIIGKNGTEFIFEGLRHNTNTLKSLEGLDVAWVEEAQTVSGASWEILTPTIRKPGSEIWISFNPELDTDETYVRFVLRPPRDSYVVKVNWNDNPFFTDVLYKEMMELKENDYDSYLTVWEGHCRHTLDGAIFAKELRQAMEENRITQVLYDRSKPVHTFWDLGWADRTSIWFGQAIGLDYNIIDFYQNNQKTTAHYLEVLQGKGYVYGVDYLPHDASSGNIHSNGRGMDQMMRAAGRKIKILPRVSKKAISINAARTIFPNCRFDELRCADGLQSLRRYRYGVNQETGQFTKEPLHDENSHAADAFQTLALSLKSEQPIRQKFTPVVDEELLATGWMQ